MESITGSTSNLSSDRNEHDEDPKEWQQSHKPFYYYGWFAFILMVLYVIVITTGFTISEYAGWLAVFGSVTHLALSVIRNVPEDQVGAMFLFGAPILELPHGWVFAPLGFTKLKTVTQGIVQIIIGTEARDREGKLAETYDPSVGVIIREKAPERIVFGDINVVPNGYPKNKDVCEEYRMPTLDGDTRKRLRNDKINRKVICDTIMIGEFRVDHAVPYFIRVKKLEILSKMVAATSVAALNESTARIPLGFAQENKSILEGRVRVRIEEMVGERQIKRPDKEPKWTPKWGVDFIRFMIKDWGHPHSLNTAIKEANEAGFKKIKTVTESEGDAERIRNLGLATAEAEGALLKERGKGLQEVANVASSGHGGLVAVQADAHVRAMQSGNTNIVSSDVNPLLGVASLASGLLDHHGNKLTSSKSSQAGEPTTSKKPSKRKTPPKS